MKLKTCGWCVECKKKNKTHEIYVEEVVPFTPIMFEDKRGRRHVHQQAQLQQCQCSNGHTWIEPLVKVPCPTCGHKWEERWDEEKGKVKSKKEKNL